MWDEILWKSINIKCKHFVHKEILSSDKSCYKVLDLIFWRHRNLWSPKYHFPLRRGRFFLVSTWSPCSIRSSSRQNKRSGEWIRSVIVLNNSGLLTYPLLANKGRREFFFSGREPQTREIFLETSDSGMIELDFLFKRRWYFQHWK